jgi:hypothetical protein
VCVGWVRGVWGCWCRCLVVGLGGSRGVVVEGEEVLGGGLCGVGCVWGGVVFVECVWLIYGVGWVVGVGG